MARIQEEHTTRYNAEEVRYHAKNASNHSTAVKKKKKKKNKVTQTLIYLACVTLAAVVLGECAWLVANDLCAFNKEYKEATITVVKSDTVEDITNKLKENGLVEYKFLFKLFADFIHADQKIGVGTYELNTNMDYKALVNHMKNVQAALSADTVKVTVPEGFTCEKIFERLEEYGVCSKDALMEAALKGNFDYTFLDSSLAGSIRMLEGYLFPDTYEFYVNNDPKKTITKMLDNWHTHFDSELLSRITDTGYSLDEILRIASLIEAETDGKDHANIASVIYNRLNNRGGETNGFLQIDACSKYSKEEGYDLYKTKGLPPTCINNPGMNAINAAIEPNKTIYMFYALGKDGRHHFFKNYADHLAFVNSDKYQPLPLN